MAVFMSEFKADSIKLGPEPRQFAVKPKPEATAVVEASSEKWKQKQREELEEKRENVRELKDQLSRHGAQLGEMLNRLMDLTKRGEWLKEKIEEKKQEMKALTDYIWKKKLTSSSSDDIRALENEMGEKDWIIRSISQQGGKEAEAKIAKVMESKDKLERRLEDRRRSVGNAGAEIERAVARKADDEREIRGLEHELSGIEIEIAQVAETARIMYGEKKMLESRIADVETEIGELEEYFGWVEKRHMPKVEVKKEVDAGMLISTAEQMRLRRITALAEIDQEIEEMNKEREESSY